MPTWSAPRARSWRPPPRAGMTWPSGSTPRVRRGRPKQPSTCTTTCSYAATRSVATCSRSGGRAAPEGHLPALAREVRARDPRRHRLDGAVPHFHREPSRPGAPRLERYRRPWLRGETGRRCRPRSGNRRGGQSDRQRRQRLRVLLEPARAHQANVRRRVGADGRQVHPGRGRVLLVRRSDRRYDQSGRHVGVAGGGRKRARRASGRRGSGRGGCGGQRRAGEAAGVRRTRAGPLGEPGARDRAQDVRERAPRALQVPALDRVRGGAAEDGNGEDPTIQTAGNREKDGPGRQELDRQGIQIDFRDPRPYGRGTRKGTEIGSNPVFPTLTGGAMAGFLVANVPDDSTLTPPADREGRVSLLPRK